MFPKNLLATNLSNYSHPSKAPLQLVWPKRATVKSPEKGRTRTYKSRDTLVYFTVLY